MARELNSTLPLFGGSGEVAEPAAEAPAPAEEEPTGLADAEQRDGPVGAIQQDEEPVLYA